MSKNIGTLEIGNEIKVEWRIVDFFSLTAVNSRYPSPQFAFLGESWFLEICPNGEKSTNREFIALYLYKRHVSNPASVFYSLCLKTKAGGIFRNYSSSYIFKENEGRGYNKYMKRLELIEQKDILLPSDVLTIICCIRKNEQCIVFRTEELVRDVTSLVKDESDTDVVFQVEQEKFRLHRNVLQARSPVLAAMFTHEMSEKTTGVVSIQDCEADVFRTFIDYIYTGKVGELPADKAFRLFEVADKYQVAELADDCIQHMANTLTVDTLVDAVEVASDHQNKFLMKAAVRLFSDKIAEVIRTAKWESLLDRNPVLANTLLKKVLDDEKK